MEDMENTDSYQATTRDIRVVVEPVYLEEQSQPEDNHYVWAYTIQIENQGEETVQLRTRYWRSTDSTGNTQEVRGVGVWASSPYCIPERVLNTQAAHLLAPPLAS